LSEPCGDRRVGHPRHGRPSEGAPGKAGRSRRQPPPSQPRLPLRRASGSPRRARCTMKRARGLFAALVILVLSTVAAAPAAASDVKFCFARYKGAAATTLKNHVAAVEIVDPLRVRFRLKTPWPEFMTFYGTPATGAAWIVPRKYVEKVGDDGFKKAPVGAGPY